MANSFILSPSVLRRVGAAGAAAGVLITIAVSGVNFLVTKNSPTAAIRSEYIFGAKSSSGSGFFCNGYGQCFASGALTIQGAIIGTGSSLTQSATDARYVNTSGDTMTGVLIINTDATINRFTLDADPGVAKLISFRSNNSPRWAFRVERAEGGADAGSDLVFRRYSDAGALIGTGLTILRSNGRIGIGTDSPNAELDVIGTISGATVLATTMSGHIVRSHISSPKDVTIVVGTGTNLSTGSGKVWFTVPKAMSGFKLTEARMIVDTAGTTNTTSFQIRNTGKGSRKLFSTVFSIDSAETDTNTAATPGVISSGNAEVGYGDKLLIDIPGVSTTAPKGVSINLQFAY